MELLACSRKSAAHGAGIDPVVCSQDERGGIELEDRGAIVDAAGREHDARVGDIAAGVAPVATGGPDTDRERRVNG